MILKEHEKFIAFVLLGMALFAIAVMVYLRPPANTLSQSGAGLAILNTIVGALTLAFGGAANSLFKISSTEKADIAAATATAMSSGPPVPTTVEQPPENPIPVDTQHTDVLKDATITPEDDLPDYARA